MIIMKREMRTVVRAAEDLGEKAYDVAMIAPGMLEDVIDITRAVVTVPWSVVAGSVDYAADKVDDMTDMVK